MGSLCQSPYGLVGSERALALNIGGLNVCNDSQLCSALSNGAPSPCKEASDRDCGSDTCRDTCHVCGKYLSGFCAHAVARLGSIQSAVVLGVDLCRDNHIETIVKFGTGDFSQYVCLGPPTI